MPNRPVLQFGDSGSEVTVLQVILLALGFDVTDSDGDFANSTDAAVRSFQASQGLDVNGVVDDQVWDTVGSLPFGQPVQLSPDEFPSFARLNAVAGDPNSWLSDLGIDPSGLSDDDNV
jgi:peptidoglycan hydrolase-like protein with peptidoglycan-binding domain